MLDNIIKSIMDCIEECVGSLSLAAGKNIFRVVRICVAFLIMSIIFELLNLPVLINWQEALTAVIIMAGIYIKDYVSRKQIKEVLDNLKR